MSDQGNNHWKLEQDDQGISWLHLDRADSKVNTLSSGVLKELETHLHHLEQQPPKGLVILSDKKNGFIAGADVNEFTEMSDEEETLSYVSYVQSLFTRLEQLDCTTVVLINGFCMGGGTELALACDYRIALDSPSTRIALPEIKLGIHPGYGGTVRSISLMGPFAAMNMMLTGRPLNTRAARKTGLIDHAVPERHMFNAAVQIALSGKPKRKRRIIHQLASHRLLRPFIARQMRKQVAKRAPRSHYPAPYNLIELWEKHADSSNMMKHEALSIAKLLGTPTAQNLIRVFFLQSAMKDNARESGFRASHVHVIGAGIMGGDIAAWCAYKGLTVTLQDQSADRIAPAIKRANKLFSKKLKRTRPVQAALDRLIPDPEGSGLAHADVVIEAIFEDLEAKQNLFKEIEQQVKPETLLCTNTSSIPLEELSTALDKPARLAGLHFFNPVDKMQLVEVVHGKYTDKKILADCAAFTVQIGKLPLSVKSSPGFLVNRVLMPYLLEATHMVQEGISPTLIDKAALDFGMPMGPIELADKVGLDICLSVAEILSKHLGGSVPDILNDRVSSGNLGVKTERGFYEYHKGKPNKPKTDMNQQQIETIKDRLILRLLNEAVACLREGVVDSEDQLDAGIIFGTGFAPFTGGPLKYLHSLNLDNQTRRFNELNQQFNGRFEMDQGWKNLLC